MEDERRFIWGRKPCIIEYGTHIAPINIEDDWDYYEPLNLNKGENEKSLYLRFASLKTDEEIVQFVSKYGFLGFGSTGYAIRSKQKCYLKKSLGISESIEEIRIEAQRMLALVKIWEGINQLNEDNVVSAVKDLEKIRMDEDDFFEGYFIFPKKNENPYLEWIYPYRIATRTISVEVNSKLSGLSLKIEWSWEDNRFISHLLPDNLFTALYVMFQEDLTRGVKLRKCKNETCKEYFPIYGNDERKIYCDTICKAQQVQREYRRRLKNKEREK